MNKALGVLTLVLRVSPLLFAVCTSMADAEDASAFYKGRTLTIGVPNAAGGGYDTYVRALAQYLPRHISGNPTVVVQNIPAAGGMVMANQLYVTAPKDGSYIGMVRGTVLVEEVFGNPKVQFKGRNFNWLVNMNSDVNSCVCFHGERDPDNLRFLC